MAYLFMDGVNIRENDNEEFHYDHLIPKSKLVNSKIDNGVVSFANLSLISQEQNQKKSASIEKDHIKDDIILKWAQKNDNDHSIKKLIDEYEAAYGNIETDLSKDNYHNFLKIRKNIIIKMYEDK